MLSRIKYQIPVRWLREFAGNVSLNRLKKYIKWLFLWYEIWGFSMFELYERSFLVIFLQDELNTLHNLAWRMKTLNLDQTKSLTNSILHSISCPCGDPVVSTNIQMLHSWAVTIQWKTGNWRCLINKQILIPYLGLLLIFIHFIRWNKYKTGTKIMVTVWFI